MVFCLSFGAFLGHAITQQVTGPHLSCLLSCSITASVHTCIKPAKLGKVKWECAVKALLGPMATYCIEQQQCHGPQLSIPGGH